MSRRTKPNGSSRETPPPGQFTSAADAAARPGETTIEDVGTVAALRLALAAACDWIEQMRSDAPPLEVLEAEQLATWRSLLE